MRVVGLDLSLTSTGVASDDGTVTVTSRAKGMERLRELRDQMPWFIDPYRPDVVVIEGYSFGTARQASHAHALGELGGVVRLALWEAGIAYVDVPPASLKRYATGRGNAPKDEVLAAAIRRLGYEGHSHDEADALWLRQMGLAFYRDNRAVEVPQTHCDGLKKVAWPGLAVAS